jgi:raffinose/stachyose/melibiose transport system permease protein
MRMTRRLPLMKPSNIWQYLVLLFFAFIFGFPLVWTVYSSFKPTKEIIKTVWALPTTPSTAGYEAVLANDDFGVFYRNSIILTVVSAPLVMLVSSLAAFGFARVRFPGREFFFYLFVMGIVIPVHVTLIPLFILMRDLSLLGSLFSVVLALMAFSLPVSIFILRGFFEQIPVELEEAARIDGVSTFGLFWRIFLPLARPALTTVLILAGVGAWNEFLFTLTFVGINSDAYTLPIGIATFVKSLGVTYLDRMFAGLTLTVIPILVFYFVMQKQIIKSLTAGALSGT